MVIIMRDNMNITSDYSQKLIKIHSGFLSSQMAKSGQKSYKSILISVSYYHWDILCYCCSIMGRWPELDEINLMRFDCFFD